MDALCKDDFADGSWRIHAESVFSMYAKSEDLEKFHIIHVYPKELTGGEGYYGHRFFQVVGYNTDTMTCRDLGEYHDAIDITPIQHTDGMRVMVFCDGSFMLVNRSGIRLGSSLLTQALRMRA